MFGLVKLTYLPRARIVEGIEKKSVLRRILTAKGRLSPIIDKMYIADFLR